MKSKSAFMPSAVKKSYSLLKLILKLKLISSNNFNFPDPKAYYVYPNVVSKTNP